VVFPSSSSGSAITRRLGGCCLDMAVSFCPFLCLFLVESDGGGLGTSFCLWDPSESLGMCMRRRGCRKLRNAFHNNNSDWNVSWGRSDLLQGARSNGVTFHTEAVAVQQKHCISIRAFTTMLSTQINCHEIYTVWFPRRVLASIQTTFESRVIMCCLLETESSIFTENCKRR